MTGVQTCALPIFIARDPVDLLAVVPFAIGFHPEDSVVLLAFGPMPGPAGPGIGRRRRTGRHVGAQEAESFHARVDLPVVEHEQREVARILHDVVLRHGARMVGLVIYSDDVAAATTFAGLLVPDLLADGIAVVDVLRVDGDHFFTVADPDDPGTPYDLSTHEYTAEQVLGGRVVLENRSALLDSLIGTDEEDLALVAAAANTMVDELLAAGEEEAALGQILIGHARWVQRTVRSGTDPDGARAPLPASQAGRLLVLVAFDALREVAWAEMSRETAREHVELWRELTRRAPDDLRSGAGSLLAFAAWLTGNGALACCALERCFGPDPDDSLAQHVLALIESATPPMVWTPVPSRELRIFQVGTGSSAVC